MSVIQTKTLILKCVSNSHSLSNGGAILKINTATKKATLSCISFKELKNTLLKLAIAINSQNVFIFDIANPPQKESFLLNEDILNSNCVSALIFCLSEKQILPLNFGVAGNTTVTIREFINFYAKNYQKSENDFPQEKACELSQTQEFIDQTKTTSPKEPDCQTINAYNDEAVAEINYFELENFKREELKSDELYNQTNDFNAGNFTQEPQEEDVQSSPRYENSPLHATQKEPQYYSSIKEKLSLLFDKYPPISALTDIIPESKWVKIPYSNNKHYTVGLISENNLVRFIVYGVPGVYNSPPSGLENYTCFIPESVYQIQSAGYWCIFQDAESGEKITEAQV